MSEGTAPEGAVLPDTSCWIEYLHPNGSAPVKAALREAIAAGLVTVCGPVVCEVLRGTARADQARVRNALEGQTHLSQEDADWREVGRVLTELQPKGLQPPILDVLIAVIAARHAVALWHFGDRHFAPLAKVVDLELRDLRG